MTGNHMTGNQKKRYFTEKTAEWMFTACGLIAVFAVASITIYMLMNGIPALFETGLTELLFGTLWQPTAAEPSFGILFVILTSIIGTAAAVLLGAIGNKAGNQ